MIFLEREACGQQHPPPGGERALWTAVSQDGLIETRYRKECRFVLDMQPAPKVPHLRRSLLPAGIIQEDKNKGAAFPMRVWQLPLLCA